MYVTADDLCRLAADLTREHGSDAIGHARRAVLESEAQGAFGRARFWFTLTIFLDDIAAQRLDPATPITLH